MGHSIGLRESLAPYCKTRRKEFLLESTESLSAALRVECPFEWEPWIGFWRSSRRFTECACDRWATTRADRDAHPRDKQAQGDAPPPPTEDRLVHVRDRRRRLHRPHLLRLPDFGATTDHKLTTN